MTLEERLRDWVRRHLAQLLNVPPESIALDRTLVDYGLDSVDAVLMAGELEGAFEMEIDPALFLKFDTFEAMVVGLASAVHSGS
jgi:acyl carrier protein